MKKTGNWLALAAFIVLFTACEKDGHGPGADDRSNHVYSITNGQKGNLLIDYRRAADGTLSFDSAYQTGGLGTGAGLGSQGAVIITDDGIVLAVNAGSNSISSFRTGSHGAILASTVPSGGDRPISITAYGQLVYVLNAGGAGNITGFTLSANGKLSPLANSTRPLSSSNAGPAQVSFLNDGRALVVTEKNTNTITSYTRNGTMHTFPAAHPTPFGFAVGPDGNIYVSEAAGGAPGASTVSAYHVDNNGVISLINGPVSGNQTAACWVVLTDNGRYAYATNTGSNTVSSFGVSSQSGKITLANAVAASTGSSPTDAAFSNHSKYLYILTSASGTINAYKVSFNGDLSAIQTVENIPSGVVGLAAQ
jgi:6-phosphogluconolactonase